MVASATTRFFGPGNGGNGGNAGYVFVVGGIGDSNFGGTATMAGGNGGNGGNVTVTSSNNGGIGGSGGSADYFEIDASGVSTNVTGYSVYLSANIGYDVGVGGSGGSDTVGGHYGFFGSNGNGSNIYLYSQNGSIAQSGGSITSMTGEANVNAYAGGNGGGQPGSVTLTSANNGINNIGGQANGGVFQVTSNQGLSIDGISAVGEIDLSAPYLYVYEPDHGPERGQSDFLQRISLHQLERCRQQCQSDL